MTVALFVASLATTAQTQNSANPNSSSPFPFQTDAQKQEWINANPKAYVNMGGDKASAQTAVTPDFTNFEQKEIWLVQQEAEAMLEKVIPPTVITQEQKEAWLLNKELSAKNAALASQGIVVTP